MKPVKLKFTHVENNIDNNDNIYICDMVTRYLSTLSNIFTVMVAGLNHYKLAFSTIYIRSTVNGEQKEVNQMQIFLLSM